MVHSVHVPCRNSAGHTAEVTFELSVIVEEFDHDIVEVQVLCYEQHLRKSRDANSKEFAWRLRRRIPEFYSLEVALRESFLLPTSLTLPRRTLVQHMLPLGAFMRETMPKLQHFLDAVLKSTSMGSQPGDANDHQTGGALLSFLGFQFVQAKPGTMARWLCPDHAEERQTTLLYSLDKGIYIRGHRSQSTFQDIRITRLDRSIHLGDVTATQADVRTVPASSFGPVGLQRTMSGQELVTSTHIKSIGNLEESRSSSPEFARKSTSPDSLTSSPRAAAEMESCDPRIVPDDDCCSILSASTADTESCAQNMEPAGTPISQHERCGVWMEANLDKEIMRIEEQARWWRQVLAQRSAHAASKGASRSDCLASAPSMHQADAQARTRVTLGLMRTAAMYREISLANKDLNGILGYGVDGRSFVVVQAPRPSSIGLRSWNFTAQRCFLLLGQALRALSHLHIRGVAHGCLSPESFLLEDHPLGPRLCLAWTPGQRRFDGHAMATRGFCGPCLPGESCGDLWALACVVLTWWQGFKPVPHPWTQFAQSRRLAHDIQSALGQDPPQMPRALLDLHLTAATAEEPEHSFLMQLASLLTACLSEPSEIGATDLLNHPFFEQAL